jgi:proline iminopeptidase
MNPELGPHFFTGEAATMDLRVGLAAVTCPVLVLGGELDPVMPPRIVRELVDALPAGLTQFEQLPGVSHFQVAGRPASTLVKAFIQATT